MGCMEMSAFFHQSSQIYRSGKGSIYNSARENKGRENIKHQENKMEGDMGEQRLYTGSP